MNITYLAQHKSFIPTIAKWYFDEWSYINPDRTLKDVESLITERTTTDSTQPSLVAQQGDRPLGTVCLKLHDMDTRTDLTPWLAGLYVDKPWRNRGIGAKLVAAIEQVARKQGIQKLYLYTPDAEGFYSRLGWKLTERCDYHSYAVTIMEKQLII